VSVELAICNKRNEIDRKRPGRKGREIRVEGKGDTHTSNPWVLAGVLRLREGPSGVKALAAAFGVDLVPACVEERSAGGEAFGLGRGGRHAVVATLQKRG
jgi:hypothetical protein